MSGETVIGLLLIDGFALMSYASFVEPFRAANTLAKTQLYRWHHVAVAGDEAFASSGTRVLTDARVGERVDCDMLFVFAAGTPADFQDETCFAWLRGLARRGVCIGGISGGPYILARAGLLTNYRATIHWEHAPALQVEFPELKLETGLYTIDRSRMTCAGGTASLDLALSLIERDHGTPLASSVSDWFVRGEARRPELAQRASIAARYGVNNRRLQLMLAAMEASLEEPLPRPALAACAGVTLRQLERLSTVHLGGSVAEVYYDVRLAHGAELLRSTGLSVTEIALICGFKTAAHFSRRFKDKFGRTPRSARR